MKFVDLKKHLAEGPILPCYIITGDDSFVVRSAIDHFVALVGGFKELDYAVLGKDTSVPEIVAALSAPPLFTERRVVRVADYAGDLTGLVKYLDSPVESSVLLFTGALTPNFNAIMKRVELVDCNRLDRGFIMNWAVRTAAKRSVTLTSAAAAKLVDDCARDMSRISTELNKLCDYAGEGEISEREVALLVAPEPEFKVYELSEAIATGDGDKAVALAQSLAAESTSVMPLLSMVFNHFRRLLFASLNPSAETLAAELGAKEYAVKVAMRQASAFSQRRLKYLFDRLCDYDRAVKAGEISDKNALLTFVCETVTTPRR